MSLYFDFPCKEYTLGRYQLYANFNQSLKQQGILFKGFLVCHCPLNYVIHVNKPLVQIVSKYSVKVCWKMFGAVFNLKGSLRNSYNPRCVQNAILCLSDCLSEICQYPLTKSHFANTFPWLTASRTLAMDGRG